MGGNPVPFHEEQRFRQVWLWVMLVAVQTAVLGPLLFGIVGQLVFGEPFGTRPASDAALALGGTAAVLFCGALTWLFLAMALRITVDGGGILVRFRPFLTRRLSFGDIADCVARRYRPILEFGGWGIRVGWRKRAYNVSGNLGVQLVLRDGRRVLLGSQRPAELAAAILAGMAAAAGAGAVGPGGAP
jgi:hypothetical protein